MPAVKDLLSHLFLKAAFVINPPGPVKNISDDFVEWLCFAKCRDVRPGEPVFDGLRNAALAE